jgi:hypothetical protein
MYLEELTAIAVAWQLVAVCKCEVGVFSLCLRAALGHGSPDFRFS